MLDRLLPELLDKVLLELDLSDLIKFSNLAKFSHQHLFGNPIRQHLWHSIYLKYFDPPQDFNFHHQTDLIRSNHKDSIDSIKLQEKISSEENSLTFLDWKSIVQERFILYYSLTNLDDDWVQKRLIKYFPKSDLLNLYSIIFEIFNTSIIRSNPSNHSNLDQSLNISFIQNLFLYSPAQFRILHYSGLNHHHQPLFAMRPSLNNPLVISAAKLHTIYGLTSFDLNRPRTRGLARESCYALANYHPNNFYGPFMPDQSGKVNWAHLESLSILVRLYIYHLRQKALERISNRSTSLNQLDSNTFSNPQINHSSNNINHHSNHIFNHSFDSSILDHSINSQPLPFDESDKPAEIDWPILNGLWTANPNTQLMHPDYDHPPYPWPPSNGIPIDLNHYDWAGVTGKWLRIVCFLDYRDLHAYNFTNDGPRPTLDEHKEALRAMTLDLEVTSIGQRPNGRYPLPACLQEDIPNRPPIYFKGTLTYNLDPASLPIEGQTMASLGGCVSCTADGEVRWTVVSTLSGMNRWASEGIQVGGPRSKWGVLGAWTDINRNDKEGPAGPFYFFKIEY
ncbi:hypothetical protein O181_099348 [Austropuccinia psidii MF-1]|uniref:F-box domain-containing protein n=1 Tax=Austropuccinia psidii MF-1 TaxID=1389203 RepID=A0A9Q3JCI3_9BASI|nr:hypothetical protein [Austropuccinia psidii MF-1]